MLLSQILQRSGSVGGRVTISNVRLVDVEAVIENGVDDANSILQVVMELDASFRIEGPALTIRVSYGLRTHLKDDPSRTIYRIDTAWLASYEVEPGEPVDPLDAEAFAVTSGPFAVHPYQRELVQRISGQMGFTPLVLNVLRSPVELASGQDREVPLGSEAAATSAPSELPEHPGSLVDKSRPAKSAAKKAAPRRAVTKKKS